MKIKKEFSPVTITLETETELRDLLEILSAASSHYSDGRYVAESNFNNSMREKCYMLGKDLKK